LLNGIDLKGYEGLRGEALDLALVDKEQKIVTELMNLYFISNRHIDKNAILERISYQFNPESPLYSLNLTAMKNAIKSEFISKGEIFDIGHEEHRIRLGHFIVKELTKN
jgi:hypothetical protein